MRAFAYARPRALEDALALLQQQGAAPLAGGTDLVSLLKDDVVAATTLVDLRSVDALGGIEQLGDGDRRELRVGATVSLAQLADHSVVRAQLPALATAIEGVRSPQIRNMGTVAGDLCQRPRCWYFRAGFGLNAVRDGRSMVVDGDNRYHAILGAGPGYFVHASSLAAPLVALAARAEIARFVADGTSGAVVSRAVPVEALYRMPSAAEAAGSIHPAEMILEPGEIVTAVHIPLAGLANATYEVRDRKALDWPLATASVSIAGGDIGGGRIVLGHVAHRPWRALSAEEILRGTPLGADLDGGLEEDLEDGALERVVAAVATDAKPLSRNGYKVQLARVAVRRALMECLR